MKGRIKVLHVSTTCAGGLGQSILTIMTSLDRDRYDLSVAFGLGHPLDDAYAAAGFKFFPLSLSRGIHPLQFAITVIELIRIMRSERFDIVHVHGSEAGILARIAAWWVKVPVIVVELHGYANRDPNSFLERTLYRWIEKALDPISDAYVAVSDAVRRAWVARGIAKPERIEVIHHALDLTHYPATEPEPIMKLQFSGPVIGTACLLEERKGLLALVEAIPEVVRAFGNVTFLIIGEGPLKDTMQRRLHELGVAENVRFLGWRNDLARLMWKFDFFVLPSLRESFGLVFIEAMACQRPVIGSRVDGIPEVVSDGETGILVKPNDPKDLAQAILRMLSNPALVAQMGKAGRHRVETLFDLPRMAAAYEALYTRLVAKKLDCNSNVKHS